MKLMYSSRIGEVLEQVPHDEDSSAELSADSSAAKTAEHHIVSKAIALQTNRVLNFILNKER